QSHWAPMRYTMVESPLWPTAAVKSTAWADRLDRPRAAAAARESIFFIDNFLLPMGMSGQQYRKNSYQEKALCHYPSDVSYHTGSARTAASSTNNFGSTRCMATASPLHQKRVGTAGPSASRPRRSSRFCRWRATAAPVSTRRTDSG